METQALSGLALEWAVQKLEIERKQANLIRVNIWILKSHDEGKSLGGFTTNWSMGGPIIDREGILFHGQPGDYQAWVPLKTTSISGPTHLIAAMRCYVRSKLGDTVELPDALN